MIKCSRGNLQIVEQTDEPKELPSHVTGSLPPPPQTFQCTFWLNKIAFPHPYVCSSSSSLNFKTQKVFRPSVGAGVGGDKDHWLQFSVYNCIFIEWALAWPAAYSVEQIQFLQVLHATIYDILLPPSCAPYVSCTNGGFSREIAWEMG